MKIIVLTIGTVFLNVIVLGQLKDTLLTVDQISSATVYIRHPGRVAGNGTGNIFAVNSRYFIVTAGHVADSALNSSEVIFRLRDDRPMKYNLSLITRYGVSFTHHPIADVALIEVFPDANTADIFREFSIPSQLLVADSTVFFTGLEVFMFGYPLVSVIGNRFSPIKLTTRPASGIISIQRSDKPTIIQDFIFLESPSIQGMSGGFVYLSVLQGAGFSIGFGKSHVIGIIHGTFFDATGGKLAMITPGYYIYDLFKLYGIN